MLDAAVKAISQILSPPMRSILWRSIGLALFANAALMVAEVAAAFAFHSLTLLADSVHLLTDVSGRRSPR